MRQRSIFTMSEGDSWFRRNRVSRKDLARRSACDPLLSALAGTDSRPSAALEIGASNGWRMAALAERHPGMSAVALEPSSAALSDARASFPELAVVRATSERLPFADRSFDLVVLGFFLYLVDREDLFRVAFEVDRVLVDGGRVALLDFHAESPHKNDYVHHDDVSSYKMDYTRMFAWNPLYEVELHELGTHPGGDARNPDDRIGVALMRRSPATSWPVRADTSAATVAR